MTSTLAPPRRTSGTSSIRAVPRTPSNSVPAGGRSTATPIPGVPSTSQIIWARRIGDRNRRPWQRLSDDNSTGGARWASIVCWPPLGSQCPGTVLRSNSSDLVGARPADPEQNGPWGHRLDSLVMSARSYSPDDLMEIMWDHAYPTVGLRVPAHSGYMRRLRHGGFHYSPHGSSSSQPGCSSLRTLEPVEPAWLPAGVIHIHAAADDDPLRRLWFRTDIHHWSVVEPFRTRLNVCESHLVEPRPLVPGRPQR
ncbi:hypothetical protein [Acidipropionibacterium jensenii]|uniref:hypothetical protein n=1 Tax=Acidipropionibacterium jensenii TaxID=1749 RepID=UPI00214AAEA3|nr:hypothetical protein [Acidipropionibacterium jensenii]